MTVYNCYLHPERSAV